MTYLRTLWYLTLCSPYSSINSCIAYTIRNRFLYSTAHLTNGPPWRILYFGTDNFSLTCIEPVCEKLRTNTLIRDLAVVSYPGSIIWKFAKRENLTIYQWPFNETDIKNKYDIGIIVSFGRLIPKSIIKAIPLGLVNVHGSLLPQYRGAAPVVHAVKNGNTFTGVTVFKIEAHRFDTGEIINQFRVSIGPDEKVPELTHRLAVEGARLLMHTIEKLPRCLETSFPQTEFDRSQAPRINSSVAIINWGKMDSKTIYDLHRAVSHIYPLICSWHGTPMRLLNISLYEEIPGYTTTTESKLSFLQTVYLGDVAKRPHPGRITWIRERKILKIQCVDRKFITCSGFWLAGKKAMNQVDFYNGYLTKRIEYEWVFT